MYKLTSTEEARLENLQNSGNYGKFEGIQDFPLQGNDTYEDRLRKVKMYKEQIEEIGSSAVVISDNKEAEFIYLAIFGKKLDNKINNNFKRRAS